MVDSRTNPMAPNPVGDDAGEAGTGGEQIPLDSEMGGSPLPGSLDIAQPDTSPTENPDGDPGLAGGSRDPDVADSAEDDGRPEDRGGDTPYDAQGALGSEGA
jgi:hypothetical protein